MISYRTGLMRCPSVRLATIAVVLAVEAVAGAPNAAMLEEVARAEGEAYVRLRDALLSDMTAPWDFATLSRRSWETGLAAFILNQEHAEPNTFGRWGKQPRILHANGTTYQLRHGPRGSALAFLWEKMWKSGDERVRDAAYHDLYLSHARACGVPGEVDLWRAIWENVDDERYRHIAILLIASANDSSTSDVIAEVLAGSTEELGILKHACLVALKQRKVNDTGILVVDAWGHIEERRGFLNAALGVLGFQDDEQSRRFLYSLTRDSTKPDWLRSGAMSVCAASPCDTDAAALLEFIKSDASDELKAKTLNECKRWALANVRPAVRHILRNGRDPNLVRQAIFTLTQCYIPTNESGPEAVEDARLVRAIADDEAFPASVCKYCPDYIRIIEGRRGHRFLQLDSDR